MNVVAEGDLKTAKAEAGAFFLLYMIHLLCV